MATNSPFQVTGLGSGVDTGSILDTLRTYRMRPAALEQKKQETYATRQAAWMDLNVRLLALQNSAQALTYPSAFGAVKAASGDDAVASVSATPSAAPGAFALSVSQLAQARKVVSGAITGIADANTALNWTGDFSVNGKFVDVTGDDSLSSLAAKINALNAGASAAVVQTTPGQYKLTLGASATGRLDALSLADVNGGDTLSARLGILSASTADLRYASGAGNNAATSLAFAAPVASGPAPTLGALTGLGARTGTFTVNGASVGYDTAVDTLGSLANKINAATGGAASATVIADTANAAKQRLQISGVTAAAFAGDAGGLLGVLGVTQNTLAAPERQLSAAQDAVFTLDNNLLIERPTNTISDVLPGVTLTLKKAGAAASTTISLARDAQPTVDAVNSFVKSYNDVMGKIRAQSTFTPGGTTPPLLGDFALQRLQEDLANNLAGSVAGQPEGFATLRDIGVTLGQDGNLSLSSGALIAALARDSTAVSRLFTQHGSATNPTVSFVSATADTKPTKNGYDVVVTTAAAKAGVVGATPLAGSPAETLTFRGALFSGSSVTVAIAAGSTLAQTVATINASAAVGTRLQAYDAGGTLGLRSLDFGSSQSFLVGSDQASGPSGVGTTERTATGVNAAGTINGETATGVGRTLTGSQAAGAANGLAVTIGALVPGTFGKVSMQRGAAASFAALIGQLTDPASGSLKQEQDSLQKRIDDSKLTVADLSARVDSYIERMQRQFTRMEAQISRLKSQGSQLSQTIAGLNKKDDN